MTFRTALLAAILLGAASESAIAADCTTGPGWTCCSAPAGYVPTCITWPAASSSTPLDRLEEAVHRELERTWAAILKFDGVGRTRFITELTRRQREFGE